MTAKISRVLLISVVTAQLIYAIGLKDAAVETLTTNPKVLEKKKEFNMAISDLDIAKSGYKPKVDFRASTGREQSDTKTTGYKDVKLNSETEGVTFSQNLFEGFATQANVDLKKTKLKALSFSFEETVNDTLLNLSKAYIDVIKNQELFLIEKDNTKIHEKIFSDVKMQIDNGTGRVSNLKDIGAKLALSYANLLVQENNYKDALASFHKIFGRYEKSETLEPVQFNFSLPGSLEDLLNKTLAANPSILAQNAEVQASHLTNKLSKSAYYPSLDFEFNAKRANNTSGIEGTDKTASAMVNLKYNLYNGNADEAKNQQNISAIHKQIQMTNNIRREVMQNATLAWNEYKSLEEQIGYLTLYKETAEEKKNIFQEEFDLGRRSLTDLLDAADDYDNSRRKMVASKYELIKSKFRLLDAMGTINSFFGVDIRENLHFDSKTSFVYDASFDYKTDGDLVDDEKDICQNSLKGDISSSGCKYIPYPEKYSLLNFSEDLTKYKSSKQSIGVQAVKEVVFPKEVISDEVEIKKSKYTPFEIGDVLNKLDIKNSVVPKVVAKPTQVQTKLLPVMAKPPVSPAVIVPMVEKQQPTNVVLGENDGFRAKFLKANPEHFTINLSAENSVGEAKALIKQYKFEDKAFYFTYDVNGRRFVKVIYGIYETKEEVQKAIAALPPVLHKNSPWADKIGIKQAVYNSSQNIRN